MRRSLLAVPLVVALGAGGYAILHGGSHTGKAIAPPHPATVVRTRDGRVIDLADVHAGVAAPAPITGSGAPTAATASATSPGGSAAPATSEAATAGSAPIRSAAAISADVPPAMPAGSVARFEAKHASSGAAKPLPLPVRGSRGLQNKLGAAAQCQGPEYSTLTGQARIAYAKRCAKVGVTLPP